MQKDIIIRSIVAYLTKQQHQEGAVSDPESLGVAVQMIRDLYGLHVDDDDAAAGAVDLAELFASRPKAAEKTAKDVDNGAVSHTHMCAISSAQFRTDATHIHVYIHTTQQIN